MEEKFFDVDVVFKKGRVKRFLHVRLNSIARIEDKYLYDEDFKYIKAYPNEKNV